MPSLQHKLRAPIAFVSGLFIALLAGGAQAMERGTTDKGIAYASGGVGETEQQALAQVGGGYTFWLTTATQGTGAFLANVRVRILDSRGQALLDRTTDGPWLMVALPPGSYTVEATSQPSEGNPPQTRKAAFATTHGAQKRLTLTFSQPL